MKKRKLVAIVLAIFLLIAFVACKSAPVTPDSEKAEDASSSEETRIRVFETTDIHGYLMDTSSGDESTFQYRLAYIANDVNKARESKDYDDVLLLNGGNNYEGTPVSNLLEGAAIRAAFDSMDYDAISIGNHEFDYGIDTVNCDSDGTVASYKVGSISGDSDIPVLAYNLYYKGTKNRVDFARDYIVVEKGGKRIALVGYITDFSSQVMTSKIEKYEIDDDIDALISKIKEVNEKEKPDATVVVAFGGASSIASKLSKEDVVLVTGGHNQASTGSAGVAESGVAYLESACYAQGYVYLTLVFDNTTGEVSVEDTGAKAITGRGVDTKVLYDTEGNENLDKAVLAISHEAWNAVKDDMEENLGYITTPVDKTKASDNGATYAGNWITTLMLRYAKDKCGAVAAFYNNGGIRTTFTIPEGETKRTITAGDIYQINPFCNYWYIYEITGAELAQQLINGFEGMGNYGDQMSGLTFTYTQTEKAGSESTSRAQGGPGGPSKTSYDYTIESITLSDGTAVDPTDTSKTYKVCISNYSATLEGSVFENKEPLYPSAEAPIDNVTIINLLREEGKANNGLLSVDTSKRGTLVEKK